VDEIATRGRQPDDQDTDDLDEHVGREGRHIRTHSRVIVGREADL
jgi:hypothetical protein